MRSKRENFMMRELLFRGKRIDLGEWERGGIYCSPHTGTIYIQGASNIVAVDSVTVGQYTGFRDILCQQIYEGDIVAIAGQCKEKEHGAVQWRDGAFVICYGDEYELFYEVYNAQTLSVVGNIYDNPELLKRGGESHNE